MANKEMAKIIKEQYKLLQLQAMQKNGIKQRNYNTYMEENFSTTENESLTEKQKELREQLK
jgi:hypothetical protein